MNDAIYFLHVIFSLNLIVGLSSAAFLGQERPRITGRNYILLKNIQYLMLKSHFNLLFILIQYIFIHTLI